MEHLPLSFRLATAVVKLLLLAANAHCFWLFHGKAARIKSAAGRWASLAGMIAGFALLGSSGMFQWDGELFGLDRQPGVWHLLSSVWTFGLFGGYCVALALRLPGWLRPRANPQPRQSSGAVSRRDVAPRLR
jgi:hypothetical protein